MDNFRTVSDCETFKMRTKGLKVYFTSTVKVVWDTMISDCRVNFEQQNRTT